MSIITEVAEKAAALNAERLARKEGKDLIGKKYVEVVTEATKDNVSTSKQATIQP